MPPATLEQLLTRLGGFWESRGSVLLPPCELPVGFALASPDVFLRLGEPTAGVHHQLVSVNRPTDGRFGRSSLRLSRHLRFQVVERPVLAGLQVRLLDSLRAAGFELDRRDVRFVDGWTERPEFGISGRHLGLLIDGLPVARAVFVSSAAGHDLPISCLEISYGMERLASVQQEGSSLFDLQWSQSQSDTARSTFREVAQRAEDEQSRYLLELADEDNLRRRLNALDSEAERCLASELIWPAYDLTLRALHLLEILRLRTQPVLRDEGVLSDRMRLRLAECFAAQAARQAPLHDDGRESEAADDE